MLLERLSIDTVDFLDTDHSLTLNLRHHIDFVLMSMWSRVAKDEQVSVLNVFFSEERVDEEATFLALILRTFKENSNVLEELHIRYRRSPPSSSQAAALFRSIADLRVFTVTVKDLDAMNEYIEYGRKFFFSLSVCPTSDYETNTVMTAVRNRVTHVTLGWNTFSWDTSNLLLPTHTGTSIWTTLQFPRLKFLTLSAPAPYLNNLLDFLCRNSDLSSLVISVEDDDGFDVPVTFKFLPPSIPHNLRCPPALDLPDSWACSLLSEFVDPPHIDVLYLTPTHQEPPTADSDCLEHVAFVHHLFIKPRIDDNGRFYVSCHSEAKHHHVHSLTFLDVARGSGHSTKPTISAESLEVCCFVSLTHYPP